MLESVIRLVVARGYIVVAAVGNDGPAAPPLYPASYPDVIGVTAVDVRQRVLIEAGRGRQVKFAAPGSDMAAASTPESYMTVRGTSFAAPIVAGLLSVSLSGSGARSPDPVAADKAVGELMREAIDLGAPGPDLVYGNGLVGGNVRPEVALAGPQGGAGRERAVVGNK
jgi:subtilisin family serine protease